MTAGDGRSRYNSKGQLVRSNYTVESDGPAVWKCRGCGREFNAYDMRRGGTSYSPAHDQARLYARNKARAVFHADKCKGREGDAKSQEHQA